MKKFNKKGTSVLQSLILIAVMGTIAITTLFGLFSPVDRTITSINTALLENEQLDVNLLVQNGF